MSNVQPSSSKPLSPAKLVAGIVGVAAVIAIWVAFRTASGGAFNGPMVQMLSTDGFTVVWESGDSTQMTVRLTDENGALIQEVPAQSDHGRYEATFTGLSPATVYEYALVFAASPERGGRVTTAPDPATPFRFLAVGDSGSGKPEQFALARQMATYPAPLVIHTGDLVYMDGEREDYPEKYYQPYADLIRNAALYPCLGNHDVLTEDGQPMLDAFVLPENGPDGVTPERNYWFDFGDVRFAAIDSTAPFSTLRDDIAPWLDGVFKDAGDRWKVLFFHHAVVTHGKYEGSGKVIECILPICDRYHVELVLTGHNHMYERSHPLREKQIVGAGEGTVFITTGAGGMSLYELGHGDPPAELAFQHNTGFSFTVIDVTDEKMSVQQIDLGGEVIDAFEVPRQPVASQPVGQAS